MSSSDIKFCPFCGSDNIRFNGFVMIKKVIFYIRKNYFRCQDCKKRSSEVI